MTEEKPKELIIIGTGPAGFTASIYASRYMIKNILIGKLPGGQVSESHKICNYPGFEDISGIKLAKKMQDHATNLGGEIIFDTVNEISKEDNIFTIKTDRANKPYYAKSVLLAHGTKRRELNLPSEKKFMGKGLSYCATCDGSFYREQIVGVVGGSDSANTAALLLSDIADQVYLIYRKGKLRGDQMWIDQIQKKNNIEIIFNTNIIDTFGKERLEGVILDNTYNDSTKLNLDGLFIEIGSIPNTSFISSLNVGSDNAGYIKVNPDQSTNIEGLYAAGDITTGSNNFRQIVTATAEGAIAVNSINQYLG